MTTESPISSPLAGCRADHVGLRVADREAAVAWYQAVLDFRVIKMVPFDETMTFVFLASPGGDHLQLELLAGPGASPRPAWKDLPSSLGQLGWHHICLAVPDVCTAIAELKRRSVNIVQEPFDVASIHRRIAFFADPWGNIFELTQPLSPTN